VTLVAGGSFGVHATTIGADGGTLVGSGAIQFAFQGALASATTPALCLGDCASFGASAPGDGAVVMTASSATTTLLIHALPATAVDTVAFPQPTLTLASGASPFVTYVVTAAGAPVYSNVTCDSSEVGVVTVETPTVLPYDPYATLVSGRPSGTVNVTAVHAGTSTVTCSVNGHAATLTVTVQQP